MARLSLKQALGQKLMLCFAGTESAPDMLAVIQRQHVGGVTLSREPNVKNPAQVRRLTDGLQKAAVESGQPLLLVGADQEGGQLIAVGDATPFPGNMALGATGSVALARRTGSALGRELAAMGINVNYAPVCDVNTNPQNPVVGTRSFGEDPGLVAKLGVAMIEGLQDAGVAATAKHFPGHGDTSTDSHHGLPTVPHTRERAEQVELLPFVAVIEADVRLIMTAHVAYPALEENGEVRPATMSPTLVQRLLREQLGFRGVVISDAMNMAAVQHGGGMIARAIQAAAAGVDLIMVYDYEEPAARADLHAALLQAAQEGLLAQESVMASAERVLALKQWMRNTPQPPLEAVGCAEHRDLAFEIAARSVTLVRDEAGLLPLRPSPDARLAVVVPQPADLTPADTSSYVTCTLAQALRRYHASVDEFVVPHVPSDSDIAALQQRASDYELIVVGTINAFQQPAQASLVNSLLESGAPVVAVGLRLPYDLQAYPTAPTYVCTYCILPPAMEALAQALLGQVPFQGRLPASIPQLYPLGHGVSARSA